MMFVGVGFGNLFILVDFLYSVMSVDEMIYENVFEKDVEGDVFMFDVDNLR